MYRVGARGHCVLLSYKRVPYPRTIVDIDGIIVEAFSIPSL